MKLIDKFALVAEIERRLNELYNLLPNASKVENGMITISESCNTGKYTALESFKDYIDSLEVKEVDLENKWIDCSERMPEETMRNSDFLQVQQEWNESEKVLAYDSMYGARVDYTVNGKWHSELQRGVGGQILHGIIAWMPIPKYV